MNSDIEPEEVEVEISEHELDHLTFDGEVLNIDGFLIRGGDAFYPLVEKTVETIVVPGIAVEDDQPVRVTVSVQ